MRSAEQILNYCKLYNTKRREDDWDDSWGEEGRGRGHEEEEEIISNPPRKFYSSNFQKENYILSKFGIILEFP